MTSTHSNLPGQIPFKCADFYLDEDRFEDPKEVFKFIKGLIDVDDLPLRAPLSLLDVGCATGELIYYLKTQYPTMEFVGLDHDDELLDKARTVPALQDATWIQGDAEAFEMDRKLDIITCLGTITLFEDFRISLRNFIKHLNPGGRILIQALFNDAPIDVRVQFRENYPENENWTINGYNINSRNSVAHFLNTEFGNEVSKFDFVPFHMPVDLERREEQPVRAYTVRTADGPRMMVNGICLVLKETILTVDLSR